jgi:geranylgeranyl pyrophosphate synthase
MRKSTLEKGSEADKKSIEKILKILKQRASKPVQTAKKAILKENVQSKEAREALRYYTENFLESTAPAFVSLACEAVGGNPEKTTLIGAVTVLYVGAVDIHDDIIDQSKRKNGRSTVFGRFGKDIALLTGNALLLEGFALFNKATQTLESSNEKCIVDTMKTAFFEMGDAHALEVSLKGKLIVTPEEYLQMVKKKVAPWEAFTKIGAILGNGTKSEIDALATYGRTWGMLSTIRNDFVDLFDIDELQNRMVNEILPLPILYAFESPRIKKKITAMLSEDRITHEDAEMILNLVLRSKQVGNLRTFMRELIGEATSHLNVLKKSEAKSVLELFISLMLEDLG